MVGDHFRKLVQPLCGVRLHPGGDLGMQADALAAGESAIRHVANQHMAEGEGPTRSLRDEISRQQPIEGSINLARSTVIQSRAQRRWTKGAANNSSHLGYFPFPR